MNSHSAYGSARRHKHAASKIMGIPHILVFLFFTCILLSSAPAGALQFIEVHKDSDGGVDGLWGAYSVTVSPDGNHVYVAGNLDDAVAVFSRDAATGALTYKGREKNVGQDIGLAGAISVAVSPDGYDVYVAGNYDDAIAVLNRDGTTGALTYVEAHQGGLGGDIDGLWGAYSVTVSPDGGHVYVAGRDDSAVVVFSRDAATGALTYVETKKDGVGGVDGLQKASSVTVSPDGKHLYVAGDYDNAVAVFSRDGATGALTFVEMEQDGVGGVDGLSGAVSVAVSLDGVHVYVVGTWDNAVAVFSRDAITGALTFVEMEQDGVGGVDGLWHANSVAVNPDGSQVYVAGNSDDAVAVFSRNEATGALTFVETKKNGTDGVDGLEGAISVAVSPDGSHLYAAGNVDNAVAVFKNCYTSDLDCDGDVDIVDIMTVASRWNTGTGDPGYDSLYDLDKDGDIDVVDVMTVAVRWGWTE